MPKPDHTVAVHAALAGFLTTCTQCGGPYESAWFKLYTSDQGVSLPVAQCRRCAHLDPDGIQLKSKLDQRYAG